MNQNTLRDSTGKVLGRIQEQNGQVQVRDATGKLKGKYLPQLNQTLDQSGKLIGRGNLLSSLIKH